MSGGYFDYAHDDIVHKIFDWRVDADYNLGSDNQTRTALAARKIDPLNDVELSEMLYDLACVLKAHDWWRSSDCGVECYNDAKRYFKDKWFGKNQKERLEAQIQRASAQFVHDIKEMIENKEIGDDN